MATKELQLTAIFWIRQQDYQHFLEVCADRDNLYQTYEEWL
jgi:hypothetical protein